jgi:hypothetical protein
LKGVLDDALQAFLTTLDQHTLATIALKPREFPISPRHPRHGKAQDDLATENVRLKSPVVRPKAS